MILFPAIDILDGKCVRLLHGEYDKVTEYGEPVVMAKKWADNGAEYLHIVDLNAAKSGAEENLSLIREIAKAVKISVQTGGGMRSLDDIEKRLSGGVARVILGTVCCEEPDTVIRAVKEFGAERIVCGIDAKDGCVATRGWLSSANVTPVNLGKEMYGAGVRYVVYTDIRNDGALSGVNVAACKEMADKTRLKVMASGGVSSAADIRALKAQRMYGAILGKALYENKLTLSDALAAAKE